MQEETPKLSQNPSLERNHIKSLKAKYMAGRSLMEKAADLMTQIFGSVPFLILNVMWFAGWIAVNQSLFSSIKPNFNYSPCGSGGRNSSPPLLAVCG